MLLSKAPGPKKLQSCRGRIPLFPAIVSLLALIQASIRNRANSSYRHRRSAALGGMSIAITVGVSSWKPHRGGSPPKSLFISTDRKGHPGRLSELFSRSPTPVGGKRMKAIFGVILMSVMLLASVGGASATSYLQAASTDEHLAVD